MRRGHLSDYFTGVAVKRLTPVETVPATSNQHEFNGSAELRKLLGENDIKNIPARFLWISKEQEAFDVEGSMSWYDARRRHPTRTEYRLYYPDNEVTGMMQPGDAFFLAICRDSSALVVITPGDSTMHNQLLWLFGIEEQSELQFNYQAVTGNRDAELDFAARFILDALNIDPAEPEADKLDTLIEPFGLKFPTTRVFSEVARRSLPHVSARDDPDAALIEWMDREEQLFRRLERRIVAERIAAGFQSAGGADVDGFIKFSLSVQNTRKSRVGLALENHIEAIFQAAEIRFERGVETENKNKPDFLFPGRNEYLDPAFSASRLTMLGTKSTLKDRWRQVLSEAQRIERKHLLTLEPSISENQTTEMQAKNLQLVIPRRLHGSYRAAQQAWLLDVAEFIRVLKLRQ